MRKLLYAFLWVALAGMYGSCGQTGDSTTDEDSTAIRLGVLPTMECLPFYYADSVGLFDSLDINVKLVTFDAAMDADTAFMRGRVEGSVTDLMKVALWQDKGDTAQVVMVSELRLWLITAQKARLLKAESLKEKIIGITRHSALDYFTDKILESVKLQSIDLNKPQINNLRLRALMVDQDQLDGAIMPEPFASEAVARGAKRLNSSVGMKVGNLMCVVFADSVYRARKAEIDKIQKAYDKAVEAMNQDSTLQVMAFCPEAHRMDLPDTLFTYVPLKPSTAFHDSMLVDMKKWAIGRGLVKK